MKSEKKNHGQAGISYREEVKRKIVHLSSLWMVVLICLFPYRNWLVVFFALLFFGSLVVERMRALEVRHVTKIYDVLFGRMLRQKPQKNQWIISGGPYVFAAALLTVFLFPAPCIAAVSMAVLLVGDTAAALIGRKFGRHKAINGKSFEGFFAFLIFGFIAAAIVLKFFGVAPQYYGIAFLGVIAGAFVEIFEKQIKLDDNFSIPIAVGGTMYLFCYIMGVL